ncbi:hypothetical protein BOQ60_07165 [Chryseobacterium sp. CH1]|nr:hypothetical protein BOQ60_07165 [Chryseobacterium sp. CH1]
MKILWFTVIKIHKYNFFNFSLIHFLKFKYNFKPSYNSFVTIVTKKIIPDPLILPVKEII